MIHLLRRFQQPLMIAITVLVIIAFSVLYNTDSLTRLDADRVATVHGQGVSVAEYQRGLRQCDLALDLQMREMVGTLAGGAQKMDDAKRNYVLGRLVLREEAARLGVGVTDDETAEAIKAFPPFQTQGQFDRVKYDQIVAVGLNPRGLSAAQLEEIVRDDLLLKKMKTLLGATFAPAPSEVRAAYVRDYQKTVASVVRLKLDDFLKDVKLTDDDVKKEFEARKAVFKAPEKRKVKYVALTLPEAEKPLAGKERVEALKGLSEKASELSQALLEPEAKFDEVAAKLALPVKESAEFSETDTPAEFGAGGAVVDAAFKLSEKEPVSEVLGTEKGYYLLQLGAVIPARPLTFDEAKGKLTETLKQERAEEAIGLKGAEIRIKIDAEMKTGKSFADAALAAGVKAEAFPPFSRREPKYDQPNGQEVMIATLALEPGQLSMFMPAASGGVLVHMDRREPVDDAKFEQEKNLTAQNLARGKRESLFAEWYKARRREAGLPPDPPPQQLPPPA